MDSQHHDDIQEALSEVRSEEHPHGHHEHHTECASPSGTVALAVPHTRNPFALLWWGVRSAFVKVWAAIKKHPWWAALGFGASIACAKFACVYFGVTVLTGLMIWGMKKHP